MNYTLTSPNPHSTCAARYPRRRRHLRHAARSVLLAAALLSAIPVEAHEPSVAPATLSGTLFHATIASGTGGLPASGTFSQLFTADTDYNIALNGGAPALPASYVYTVLDTDSATIVETDVTVALEFTSATAGTFAATFTAGGTQGGTFTLEPLTRAPLVNISTRIKLTAGGNAIAGFSVTGNRPRHLLVRVVGPRLADFGVTNPLPDPQFSVFSGDTPVASNDNWDADDHNRDDVRAAEEVTGAFALKSAATDAAMVVALEPGLYTVVGSSVNPAQEGEILIEAYLID